MLNCANDPDGYFSRSGKLYEKQEASLNKQTELMRPLVTCITARNQKKNGRPIVDTQAYCDYAKPLRSEFSFD